MKQQLTTLSTRLPALSLTLCAGRAHLRRRREVRLSVDEILDLVDLVRTRTVSSCMIMISGVGGGGDCIGRLLEQS